jgi:hypothetical protein
MRSALLVARPVLLLAPLLLPWLVPLDLLPPAVAYVVTEARWLVWLGAVAATVSLVAAGRGAHAASRLRAAIGERRSLSPRVSCAVVFAAAFAGMLALIPGHRFTGDSLSGDEPKYLRLTESLYRDLDVDVASESLAPLTPRRLAANLRALGASTRSAVRGLWRAEPLPSDHQWNHGNWTLAGRHGGLYYVQSPGLPVLLLPGLAAQRVLMPDWGGPLFPVITLALLWSTTLLQTALLAGEVSGSRGAGLLAALGIALSAPLFVGGYHFYPEVAAAAAVPWLLRHALPTRPRPAPARAVALVLVAAALPWLHPKFLVLSFVLTGALLWRLRRPGWVALGAVPLLALLLFDHRVTGLLRPDALYQRYASDIYTGAGAFLSFDMVRGLLNALVAARDGLLIIAPVTVAGMLALPLLVREQRGVALLLGAAFGSLWLAAAVHDGGAPGPPGRLLAPVACVLAVPLALGLLRLRRSTGYRWTVALLFILGVIVTSTMLRDWRRSVKPYRHMFATSATDFARDLPAGPAVPGEIAAPRPRGLEILRGATVLAIVGFWMWICTRPRASAPEAPLDRWPALRNVHLAWWGTLALGSGLLRALSP